MTILGRFSKAQEIKQRYYLKTHQIALILDKHLQDHNDFVLHEHQVAFARRQNIMSPVTIPKPKCSATRQALGKTSFRLTLDLSLYLPSQQTESTCSE
jgi:hypothetical protein